MFASPFDAAMTHAHARWPQRLFGCLQLCLPTRALSTVLQRVAQTRIGWIKRLLIDAFCRLYTIDLATAAEPDRHAYPSFNAFFTRALRPGARPIDTPDDVVVSPVDGTLGAHGHIDQGRLFQAKGMTYDLAQLLAGDRERAHQFDGGTFATLYLAPHDYHRVHMPLDATLSHSHYVPGRLFGVSPACVRTIRRLFTRNERVISYFDTDCGPMAVIMVGAFCVGGIETQWAGTVCPPHRRHTGHDLPAGATAFTRGAEMGRFNLGSSVILLFGAQAMHWHTELHHDQSLVVGQPLGRQAMSAQ